MWAKVNIGAKGVLTFCLKMWAKVNIGARKEQRNIRCVNILSEDVGQG